MSLEVTLIHNLKKVEADFRRLKSRGIVNATRKALNKTVVSTNVKIAREFAKVRALKIGVIKKDFLTMVKARGSDFNKLSARVIISGRSVQLIRFVSGDKSPRNQKGVKPVSRRRKLRVRVIPGKSNVRGKLFIAKSHRGKNLVFRRIGNKRTPSKRDKQKGPIAVRVTPSLATIFKRQKFQSRIETFVGRRLLIEFDRAIKLELAKL